MSVLLDTSTAFDPANDVAVLYALETANVTESTDGIALPTIATEPTNFAFLGKMSNTPDFQRNLNNSWGYTVGSALGNYMKRGARNPEMSMPLKLTHIGLLTLATRDATTGELPRFCLAFARPGKWAIMIRDCKVNTFQVSGKQNTTGEAQELEMQTTVMGCYTYLRSAALNFDKNALMASLGSPYFWHDTRQWLVTDSAGVVNDFRRALTSFNVQGNNNLVRRGLRNFFGDDSPLSNTNEFLDEGNLAMSGEMGIDTRMPEEFLSGAKNAQNWSDISTVLSTKPGFASGGKDMLMTLGNAFPTNPAMPGVEGTARLASTIPFAARGFAVGPYTT